MLVEFIPLNKETKGLNLEEKKTFVLSMKGITELLDLNTNDPYDPETDTEGVFSQF